MDFDCSYKFICKYFHFLMNQWDTMMELRRSSYNVPSIPVHYNKTLNSSRDVNKRTSYTLSRKSVHWEPSRSVRADIQT